MTYFCAMAPSAHLHVAYGSYSGHYSDRRHHQHPCAGHPRPSWCRPADAPPAGSARPPSTSRRARSTAADAPAAEPRRRARHPGTAY